MKKIIPALLLTIATYGQKDNYMAAAIGIDARNAISGSKPTNYKPAIDYSAQLVIVSENVEINLGWEQFKAIDYTKLQFGLGYHFPLYGYIGHTEIKTTFIPTIEPSLYYRQVNERFNFGNFNPATDKGTAVFMAVALNLALQWDLSDKFSVQTAMNITQRPDLIAAYEDHRILCSGFVKGVWKFWVE